MLREAYGACRGYRVRIPGQVAQRSKPSAYALSSVVMHAHKTDGESTHDGQQAEQRAKYKKHLAIAHSGSPGRRH
jgi:hypothetical protein